MKTTISLKKMSLILCVLFASKVALAQTIITIDNNPDSISTYKTFQEAHDVAADGDIIYVQPSRASYGTVTIEKALTVVGRSHSEPNNVSSIGYVYINSSDLSLKDLNERYICYGLIHDKSLTKG